MLRYKKIIYIISELDRGGAERVAVDICNLMNANNYNVTILFTRKPGLLSKFLNKGVIQISLNRKKRYSFISLFKFIKILSQFDIVHVHCRHNFYYTRLSMIFNPFKKWDLIFHDHFGAIEIDKRVPFFFKLFKRNYKYIGVSKSLTEWATKNLNGLLSIHLLPNIRIRNDCEKIEDPVDNEKTKLKFIHVSNFHRIKNIEYSIHLIFEIKKKRKVSLSIYGQIKDSNYFDEIKSLVDSLNLTKNVFFIHDELDIPSIIRQYDIGLCTSKSESGPLVLIEYLSGGIPFLSYKTGEVVDCIIEDFPLFVIDNFLLNEWISGIDKIVHQNYSPLSLQSFHDLKFSKKIFLKSLLNIYKV